MEEFAETGIFIFRTNVSDSNKNSCITLTQALLAISKKAERDIFLKMDVEGDEILILPEIVDNIDFFSGIVLEFHRASAIWNLIITFVESLKEGGLFLDHIHINNYGNVSPNLLPNVIELSFSRATPRENSISRLPLKSLDAQIALLGLTMKLFSNHFSLFKSKLFRWRLLDYSEFRDDFKP